MADLGISESVALALAATAATAAGTGATLYANDQSQKATANAISMQNNREAENQIAADRNAQQYQQQTEEFRNRAYQAAESEKQRQAKFQTSADQQLSESMAQAAKTAQDAKEQKQLGILGKDYAPSAQVDTNIPGVNTGAVAADDAGTRVVSGGYKQALQKVSSLLGTQANGAAALSAKTNAGLLDSIGQGRNLANLNKLQTLETGSANAAGSEIAAYDKAMALTNQTASANAALFGRAENQIQNQGAINIHNAENSGETMRSVGALLGAAGNIGASYAGNSLGNPPKATKATAKKRPVAIT